MKPKEQNIHEQIAWSLTRGEEAVTAAWILHDDVLYLSYSQASPQPKPWNAVVNLIQGIFESSLDNSFFILRQRIYTTEMKNVMSHGMIKLTAKRISYEVVAHNHGLPLPAKQIEILAGRNSQWKSRWQQEIEYQIPEKFSNVHEAAQCCQRIAENVPRGEVLHDVNRAIAAILMAQDGRVLAWATNTNKINKTLHAEVATIQNYYRQFQTAIPKNATLIVSLKPCVMCAGMLVEVCEKREDLKVIYLQDDPGALARQDFLKMDQLFVPSAGSKLVTS